MEAYKFDQSAEVILQRYKEFAMIIVGSSEASANTRFVPDIIISITVGGQAYTYRMCFLHNTKQYGWLDDEVAAKAQGMFFEIKNRDSNPWHRGLTLKVLMDDILVLGSQRRVLAIKTCGRWMV